MNDFKEKAQKCEKARKRLQKEIKSCHFDQEKFQLMVNKSTDAFFLHDMKGNILDVNEQACKGLGFTREELLKLKIGDIECGLKPDKFRDIWEKVNLKEELTLHGMHRRKDGSTFPVELHLGAFKIEDKQFILALARDITERIHEEEKLEHYRRELEEIVREREFEAKAINQQLRNDIAGRKRVEEELRKSEERYKAVIDNIAVGVSLISPKMEILALNKQMREWFPGIDLAKRPVCYREFNKPAREEVCSYCPTCKTLQDGLVHEAVTETPSGDDVRNFRVISSPLKDKDGKIIAAIEMVEDITTAKRAQEALKQAKEQAELIYRLVPSAIFTVDMEKRITSWNDKAAEITGYSAREVLGKKCFIFAESPCKEKCGLFSQDLKKPLFGRKCTIKRKDGTMRLISKNSDFLRDAKSNIIGGIESFEDITDREEV